MSYDPPAVLYNAIPSNSSPILQYHGIGTHNYVCNGKTYDLRDINSILVSKGASFNGNVGILHNYTPDGKPQWTASDKSVFVGQQLKESDADDKVNDVPCQLHGRVSNAASPDGVLATATHMVRYNTHGGVPPTTCTNMGQVIYVDHAADYHFYGGPVTAPILTGGFQANFQPSTGAISSKPMDPPNGIKIPDGKNLWQAFHGIGTHNYICKSGKYQLHDITSHLFKKGSSFDGGVKVACSYNLAGQPLWSSSDNSQFIGNIIQKVDSVKPDADVAHSLHERAQGATRPDGGVLSGVSHILRLNAHGGVPRNSCSTENSLLKVDYSADYHFYAPAETRPDKECQNFVHPPLFRRPEQQKKDSDIAYPLYLGQPIVYNDKPIVYNGNNVAYNGDYVVYNGQQIPFKQIYTAAPPVVTIVAPQALQTAPVIVYANLATSTYLAPVAVTAVPLTTTYSYEAPARDTHTAIRVSTTKAAAAGTVSNYGAPAGAISPQTNIVVSGASSVYIAGALAFLAAMPLIFFLVN
ncbi:hypothetical protein BC830DRAFT_1077079 [Chytriomyces sp. MP71]|nr:hypothetical protein BC830DRAFT_1077079 [Chytriomyces sp. MP71]